MFLTKLSVNEQRKYSKIVNIYRMENLEEITLQQVLNKMIKTINDQGRFTQVSIYVLIGILILAVGYGVGRLIGLLIFGFTS